MESSRISLPGSTPKSSTSNPRSSWKAAIASTCRPERYNASICWARRCSRHGSRATHSLMSAQHLEVLSALEIRVVAKLVDRRAQVAELAARAAVERHLLQAGERVTVPPPQRGVGDACRAFGIDVECRRSLDQARTRREQVGFVVGDRRADSPPSRRSVAHPRRPSTRAAATPRSGAWRRDAAGSPCPRCPR